MGLLFLGILSIKPILYFNDEGVIEVFEKVGRKESHETLGRVTSNIADGHYQVFVIHANVPEKQKHFASCSLKEWKVIFLLLPSEDWDALN